MSTTQSLILELVTFMDHLVEKVVELANRVYVLEQENALLKKQLEHANSPVWDGPPYDEP